VSTVGRNTQGVRLIRLAAKEKLVELAAIDEGVAGDDELDAVVDGDAAAATHVVDAANIADGDVDGIGVSPDLASTDGMPDDGTAPGAEDLDGDPNDARRDDTTVDDDDDD